MRKIYILDQLGCANCGAKIEHDVAALEQVEQAVLVFPTKQLRIKTEHPDGLCAAIQTIARKYEPDITVREYKTPSHNVASDHERTDACGCGCDHTHHHEHDTICGCEHDHEHHHHEHGDTCHHHEHHHHEQEELCTCGHSHDHHHDEHSGHEDPCGCEHVHESSPCSATQRIYILEQLCCANCGAKIERAVNELDGVDSAVLVFPTKQLRVTASDHTGMTQAIQQIAQTIEPDIVVHSQTETTQSPVVHPSVPQKSGWVHNHMDQIELAIGAVLFIIGLILAHSDLFVPTVIVCVAAYIILGRHIVWTAIRNMAHGNLFDENFLMSIATLGAFAIQNFEEAVGVMLFFRIGELFEDIAVEKSRAQIMDAIDLRPETVNKVIDGTVTVIPAEDARPGDTLLIRVGDRIPLDGIILTGESFLDTSAITGEPVPVRVAPGDELTSGCVNTEGVLHMRVTRPLSDSMVTRILDSVENAAANKPKIDRFITRFARVYTPIVVCLAVLVAVVPSIVTGNWYHWIYTALTFLVISCPCALVLSVPLAFFSGIGTGSRKGILFKGGLSLEALATVKSVVMDKTGTLTYGTFTVTKLEPADGVTEENLLTAAAFCEQTSTHPIAASILAAAADRQCNLPQPDSIHETAGHGIRAELQHSVLLCGNAALMEQEGVSLPPLSPVPGATMVLIARDHHYLGRILLSDRLKSGAAQTISLLKQAGIAPAILTGDTPDSAAAIAKEAGIDDVHAKLLPQDKLDCLQQLRQKYGPVLFVGDGINDAPVLAGADVGAAMGSGADAAIEAADVVFLTSELNAILQSIGIARAASRIAKQNIIFALAVKALVMIFGLLGLASMWLAVFADTGVAMLCVLNSIRILYQK